MRNFSPRVTKLLFGALVLGGSLVAAAGVIFATSPPDPAGHPASGLSHTAVWHMNTPPAQD